MMALAAMASVGLALVSFVTQAQAPAAAPASPPAPATIPAPKNSQAAPANLAISGRVVNALTNEPVAGALVTITSAPDFASTVRAGADGGFAFAQLRAGKYVLRARRKGYAEQMYLQHETFTAAIVLGPGLDAENLVFPLPPQGVIAGQVTDSNGEAVRNAGVLLFAEELSAGKRTKRFEARQWTDDEGSYRFAGLNNGNHYLAVSGEPWYSNYARGVGRVVVANDPDQRQTAAEKNPELDVVYPITYYAGTTEAGAATAIHVTAGENARADVTLTPVPAVHVTIDLGDSALKNTTQVSMTQSIFGAYDESKGAGVHTTFGRLRKTDGAVLDPGEGGTVDQSSRNIVEIGGLRPGRVRLELSQQPAQADGPTVKRTLMVDPVNGQTVYANRMAAAPSVIGSVRAEGGGPLPAGARVTLRELANGKTVTANVEADGTFKFVGANFEPGVYRVFAGTAGGLGLRSVGGTGAKVLAGRKIEIGDAGDVNLELVLAKGVNGRVKGVAERDGKPAAGMMVVLVPEDLKDTVEYRRDESDSDGSFTLASVSPGKYTLVALDDWELEWARPEKIREYLKEGEEVVLNAGDEKDVKVGVRGAK